MSVCPEGSYVFKKRSQPIYVGSRRVVAVFAGDRCVYPDHTFQQFSIWVNLENERCATYGNAPMDKAGVTIYTNGPAEITKCAVVIFPKFKKYADSAGNAGVCDGFRVGVRCRSTSYIYEAAFGSNAGKLVYDYKTRNTIVVHHFYEVSDHGYYQTDYIVYNLFLGKDRPVSLAEGVECSEGVRVFYDENEFADYLSVE